MNNRKRMKLKAYITRKNYKVKINKRGYEMKEKKSCLHCMNASVTEEQGATFCLCDFDTDCIYISDPEKKAEKCKGYERMEEK